MPAAKRNALCLFGVLVVMASTMTPAAASTPGTPGVALNEHPPRGAIFETVSKQLADTVMDVVLDGTAETAYVTVRDLKHIKIFRTSDAVEIDKIPMPASPSRLRLSADGTTLWAALDTLAVAEIDLATEVKTIHKIATKLGDGPISDIYEISPGVVIVSSAAFSTGTGYIVKIDGTVEPPFKRRVANKRSLDQSPQFHRVDENLVLGTGAGSPETLFMVDTSRPHVPLVRLRQTGTRAQSSGGGVMLPDGDFVDGGGQRIGLELLRAYDDPFSSGTKVLSDDETLLYVSKRWNTVDATHVHIDVFDVASEDYLTSGEILCGQPGDVSIGPIEQRSGMFGMGLGDVVCFSPAPVLPAPSSPSCDINGDLSGDVVFGAPGRTIAGQEFAGRFHPRIHRPLLENATKPKLIGTFDVPVDLEQPGFYGKAKPNDLYGAVHTCFDANGDGYDDLAVSAHQKTVNLNEEAGAVHIIFGSEDGISTAGDYLLSRSWPGVSGDPAPFDHFGGALTSGDYNGDGYGDLAVGVAGADVGGVPNTGQVHVFLGGAGGLTEHAVLDQNTPGVLDQNEPGDSFGLVLTTGDVNADGHDDLVVGSPFENRLSAPDSGALHVFLGSVNGLTGTASQHIGMGSGAIPSPSTGDVFALALTSGDYDGDGFDDVAAGIPGMDWGKKSNAGRVAAVGGGPAGLDVTDVRILHRGLSGVPGVPQTEAWFGMMLASGDFNGDGMSDLTVGAPGTDIFDDGEFFEDAGQALVFAGTAAGVSKSDAVVVGASSTTNFALFGLSLAAEDHNRDGYWELMASMPFRSHINLIFTGEAYIYGGTGNGLSLSWRYGGQEKEFSGKSEQFAQFGFVANNLAYVVPTPGQADARADIAELEPVSMLERTTSG